MSFLLVFRIQPLFFYNKKGPYTQAVLSLRKHITNKMFNMQGPGSPSVFATMVTGIEHQGDWITDCLTSLKTNGQTRIETTADSEAAWVKRVAQVAEPSLRSNCDSWYIGSNIAGKPRVFMPWTTLSFRFPLDP